ncbi:MAG: hypothetical protein ACFFD4_13205, partial [Candidatus Odinarchaeota archaeon]
TAVGQGGRHNEGLYGPLPVPARDRSLDYSALIYSKLLPDKNQQDPRMKGKNFIMICFLYPQEYEAFLSSRRLYIKEKHDKFIGDITDISEITVEGLKELRMQIFSHEFDSEFVNSR